MIFLKDWKKKISCVFAHSVFLFLKRLDRQYQYIFIYALPCFFLLDYAHGQYDINR